MAQPIQYVFAATDSTYGGTTLVASTTAPAINVPLTLRANATVAVGTSAQILIKAATNKAVSFQIQGKDALRNPIGETLTTSGLTGLATSVNFYGVVTSIIPMTSTAAATITADFDPAGSSSVIFQGDIWNKQAVYAYAIPTKGAGTLAIIPQYTLEPMPKFVNRQPVYAPVWMDLTHITAASTGAVFLINEPILFRMRMPIRSLGMPLRK